MQRKTISFNGQTIFVGIDVHRTTWSVTVMADGGYVKTFSIQGCHRLRVFCLFSLQQWSHINWDKAVSFILLIIHTMNDVRNMYLIRKLLSKLLH